MAVVGFRKLELLFRKAASLDIKKNHAKDISEFVEQKLVDLLIAAERNAKMNARDVILEPDLPITKGLQEVIIEFRKLEEEIDLRDVLSFLATIQKYYRFSDLFLSHHNMFFNRSSIQSTDAGNFFIGSVALIELFAVCL